MISWPSLRVAGYAYDELTVTGPASAAASGTALVWSIGAAEACFYSTQWRFVARYATYNVIPSLTWHTHAVQDLATPRDIIKSPTSATRIGVRMLASLRGALAGGVVLSNVLAVTALWQRARQQYAQNIRDGREAPLPGSSPYVVRLAGKQSPVTVLSSKRYPVWPIFEEINSETKALVEGDAPVFWRIENGLYSHANSWKGFSIPPNWFFPSPKWGKTLYLEADTTIGETGALPLNYPEAKLTRTLPWEKPPVVPDLDLDLKEVAQGFRRLHEIACQEGNTVNVMRVILVDPSYTLTSGGGRKSTVRERIEELGLADVVIDAQAVFLQVLLKWLDNQEYPKRDKLGTIALETPSALWFRALQRALKDHGYNVIDRAQIKDPSSPPPMLVLERSSADTVHTMRQYLDTGIVQDPSRVCAIMTRHEEFDADLMHPSSGRVSTSAIYDECFTWVRQQYLEEGKLIKDIQADLDSGSLVWQACRDER